MGDASPLLGGSEYSESALPSECREMKVVFCPQSLFELAQGLLRTEGSGWEYLTHAGRRSTCPPSCFQMRILNLGRQHMSL